MKRTAVVSLIIVLLSCQYSYATCPLVSFIQTIEDPQELTQEEVEEIFAQLISFIDWEEFVKQVEEVNGIVLPKGVDDCSKALTLIFIGFVGISINSQNPDLTAFFIVLISVGLILSLIYCS